MLNTNLYKNLRNIFVSPFLLLGISSLLLFGCLAFIQKDDNFGKGVDASGNNQGDLFNEVYNTILSGNCSSCHNAPGAAGGGGVNLNFSSKAEALKTLVGQKSLKSTTGKLLVSPGKPEESFLVEALTPKGSTIYMPQGGAFIGKSKLDLVQDWIRSLSNTGVICDNATQVELNGKCACKNSKDTLSGDGKSCKQCIDPVLQATDYFTKEVYPILKTNCSGCHGDNGIEYSKSMKMSSALNFFNTTVGKPSDSIPGKTLIVPKSLENSYLYQRIISTEVKRGGRMPLGSALSSSDIAKIAKWITDGANKPDSVSLPYGYFGPCDTCDAIKKADGNSPCHPCNNPDKSKRPSYCVPKSYFLDSIVPVFQAHCAVCHGATILNADMFIDTTDTDPYFNPSPLQVRVKKAYDAIVGVSTRTAYPKDAKFRIAPSDTGSSLVYTSIHYKQAGVKGVSIGKMPTTENEVPKERIDRLIKWILSGAPGPY